MTLAGSGPHGSPIRAGRPLTIYRKTFPPQAGSAIVSSLSQGRTLGGVGSILILLTVIPGVGFILGLGGFLLVLVAVKHIADRVDDGSIFRNMLNAVVIVLIASVVATALLLLLLPQFFTIDPTRPPNPADLFTPAVFATLFLVLAVSWIPLLISALFLRRSYEAIAGSLDIPMFATVGLLYLLGAATLIIFVGFVVLFIAEVLQVVAFFSIPKESGGGAADTPLPPAG